MEMTFSYWMFMESRTQYDLGTCPPQLICIQTNTQTVVCETYRDLKIMQHIKETKYTRIHKKLQEYQITFSDELMQKARKFKGVHILYTLTVNDNIWLTFHCSQRSADNRNDLNPVI